MINKITVELDLPESIRFQYLGSVLHGVLMDYLSDDIADQLHHEFAYSPLKQRIYHKNKKVIWEIVCMSDNLFKEVVKLFSSKNSLLLKYYQTNIDIQSFQIEKINVQNMMNQLLQVEDLSRYVRLNIQTPMSFKYQNSYMIFPDVKRFFRSIMIQFDAFFEEYRMYDKETLNFLEKNVNIVDYKLKSTRFNLEKVKIPSFTGEIVFKIKGPLPFLQLTHFLLKFGEFSGSGIKTSLGMGKYSII
ncbi:CRISPR-associated endoribonuclease Cas6 [Staphylococcus epidermidis]|uniref:CRISPR-associated endoribonuclease Cas6 n=1 Tax=Staphylococcus epidermidis TaxID=1282 RepID=UPI00356627B9